MQLITGNTYPVKDQIKALGGKWNARAQGWEVIDLHADECRKLVAEAPIQPARKRSTREGHLRSRYGRCTHEDYPCCGC